MIEISHFLEFPSFNVCMMLSSAVHTRGPVERGISRSSTTTSEGEAEAAFGEIGTKRKRVLLLLDSAPADDQLWSESSLVVVHNREIPLRLRDKIQPKRRIGNSRSSTTTSEDSDHN
jgi:hypothetical protein